MKTETNWPFLNEHRERQGHYSSEDSDGFNGLFRFMCQGRLIRCIASNGEGWEHVSVSVEREHKPPPWSVMQAVKELFWGRDVWVCQFHPPASEYVNNHPGCLHLWRPTSQTLPTPPAILVGIRGGLIKAAELAREIGEQNG